MSTDPLLPRMYGTSPPFLDLVRSVEALLPEAPPVLLLSGETGTGKTLLARAIHDRSERAGSPFLMVPCGTMTCQVLEEELFGDPLGRRIGLLDLVGHGTLVLEDADRIAPALSEKVRARIEAPSHRIPRILATTRREPDPRSWWAEHVLHLPPLRRRMEDLELLAEVLLRRDQGEPVPSLEPEALEALHAHPWPGNVRELASVLRAAAELAPGGRIRGEHLRIRTRDTRPLAEEGDAAPEMILIPTRGKAWNRIEAEAVRATLEITSGNRSQAARILGISRPTLGRKIKKYEIDIPPPSP